MYTSMQSNQTQNKPFNTLVIEAWLHPPSVLTPSLIVHNLELQGIQVCTKGMTVSIDRGHYDADGRKYAVVTVQTQAPMAFNLHYQHQHQHPSHRFCCSLFSREASRSTGSDDLHAHWLGNCYVHLGEPQHALCSCRHESGHVKTWRKAEPEEEGALSGSGSESAVSVDVSVDPLPVKAQKAKGANALNAKDNLRIIQLQKKNFLLRMELDCLKAELSELKSEVGTLKSETKRANQCMQDWANKQVIERVWILETQHAQLRSEHLKQKEQQQQQQQQPHQPQQPNKCCKSLRKKLKKQHALHESACSEMLERLTQLENKNAVNECNKCNDRKCNDRKCNDESNDNCNPFDFRAIYDHYDQNHYLNASAHDDECPALDLITNHYADFVPPLVSVAVADADADASDDMADDDLFELIQIESFHLPTPPK